MVVVTKLPLAALPIRFTVPVSWKGVVSLSQEMERIDYPLTEQVDKSLYFRV